MELLPTLPTRVGMVLGNGVPTHRLAQWDTLLPDSGWTEGNLRLDGNIFDVADKAPLSREQEIEINGRRKTGKRFPTYYNWKAVSIILSQAYIRRRLPFTSSSQKTRSQWRVTQNLVYISKPLESLDVLKRLIVNRRRIDIEQAVGLVIRLLPEHAPEMIKLVPTIMTQSCMWYDGDESPGGEDETDSRRRRHLSDMQRRAATRGHHQLEFSSTPTWDELAQVLFRVRRRRPVDLTRGLRLPDWLKKYYRGENEEQLMWDVASPSSYPSGRIDDPIVVSTKNFSRIMRYVWRLLPSTPKKVLRRTIEHFEKLMVYGDDKKLAIEQTKDKASLAYSFIAAQRRLQLRVVSDLQGMFLQPGEGKKMQQNTANERTSFEEKLGEIALSGNAIDWTVLTAIQRPKGVESVDWVEELIRLVDRVCECLEQYVVIYGNGHTEHLRPKMGRGGGFRGPVDDWNAAVDVLWELRGRIKDAGYAIVDDGMDVEKDEFMVVDTASATEETERLDLPRGHKFLALDIMSWNDSWGDDALGLKRMPPDWCTWLQKRRAEGKCPEGKTSIIVD